MDLNELKHKASKGKKEAQFELGMRFLEGNDVPQDNHDAEKWFKHAAKKNHPEALYQLGLIKLEQEDYTIALNSFTKAIKRKYDLAYKPLGSIYKGSYDPHLENKKEAAKMFYGYYQYDKYDALEPLLSVFDQSVFKNSTEAHTFLKEAIDFGLVKAKYYLGLMYLTDAKYKDYPKALDFLESYYAATADVNAAKELYYLYAPQENKYPGFKMKEPHKAREFLRYIIEGNGILEGTEFIHEQGVYLPKNYHPVKQYLEKTLSRMKTSLAIDETFSKTVTLDTFDITVKFELETIYNYHANITYKERKIEKEIEEKEVVKKQTVRKGFKKTGSVKVPRTIRKIKKIKTWEDRDVTLEKDDMEHTLLKYMRFDSLSELMRALGNEQYVFEFEKPPHQDNLKALIEKRISQHFQKPKRAKKIKKDFSYEYAYLVKPQLDVHYKFQKQSFTQIIDLSNESQIDDMLFPLERRFERILGRFLRKQSMLTINQRVIAVLFALIIPFTLYNVYHEYLSEISIIAWFYTLYIYQSLSVLLGLVIGYFTYTLFKANPIKRSTYIRNYDDTTIEVVKSMHRRNAFKVNLKFLILLLLIALNLFLFFV